MAREALRSRAPRAHPARRAPAPTRPATDALRGPGHWLRHAAGLRQRRIDRRTVDELARINLARLRWIAWGMAGLTALYALAFWWQVPGVPAAQAAWQRQVAAVHAAFCAWWIVIGIARHVAARQPIRHGLPATLQWLVPAGTVIFSAALAATDQRVASGVGAYVIGCLSTSVVVLMPARTAIAVNAAGYAALHLGLAWTQPDGALRLNALADGLAVSVISGVLAALLWRKDASVISIRRALQARNKQLRQRQKALTRAALHDPLTGIYNRVELFRLAALEIERARRHRTSVGAVMLDLDHFKSINDRHGHQAGDAVLVHVAARLQAGVRKTDLLGRMGGEEFMLVLPDSDLDSTRTLAEALRHALHAEDVPLPGGLRTAVSVSCGVSCIAPASRHGVDWLYASADHALYAAKRAGRNRVEDAAGLGALSASDFQRLRK